MSQALYAKDNPAYDDIEASKWQATQVSAISVMSCAGRLAIGISFLKRFVFIECALTTCAGTGLICDYGKSRLGIPRSTSLILVSFLFFTSQVAAATIGTVKNLWVASSLLGFAYGSLFSLLATLCSEWFGMGKCSFSKPSCAESHEPFSAFCRELGVHYHGTHIRR
jgi:hypothetical protein